MTYVVTLRAADGHEITVRVSADSDERACRAAIRLQGLANERSGGWQAVCAHPAEWSR